MDVGHGAKLTGHGGGISDENPYCPTVMTTWIMSTAVSRAPAQLLH
jgi:hypothetical protein